MDSTSNIDLEMDWLEPRVRCGAEFLDERLPGWAEMIDIERLEMEDCSQCVLGQLGPDLLDALHLKPPALALGNRKFDFWGISAALTGMDRLYSSESEEWAKDHGMFAEPEDGSLDQQYAELEYLWAQAAEARLVAK